MTTHEITEEAIRSGLLQPAGKTPMASMTRSLYTKGRRTGQVIQLSEPTTRGHRARRGSVRWTLPDTTPIK